MKIGIVGYRYFNNYPIFEKYIIQYLSEELNVNINDTELTIISGGASGADTLAKKFSSNHNINFEEYPAEWNKYGSPNAAYIRNQLIVDNSEIIIAFLHPQSRGTYDTINRAKKGDIPIKIFKI
jgi:hypothetical protein